MLKFNRTSRQKIIFLFLIFTSVACETLDRYYQTQEDLDLSIKAFNFEFESKAIDSSTRFVHPNHRAHYIAKSLEMTQRVTFFEATTLDIKFFKNTLPAVITPKGPEDGFDRAVVTIRYQVTVLPSVKLKTRVIEQEWVLHNDNWFTIPDLDKFLK